MNVNLRLQGLNMLRTGAAKAAAAAVYREMEGTVKPDALERTPVDTGVLRASIMVEQPEVDGSTVRCVLGAGGAAAAYALRQHEEVGYRHTVGEAKYLSNALAAAEPGQAERVGRTFARELGL